MDESIKDLFGWKQRNEIPIPLFGLIFKGLELDNNWVGLHFPYFREVSSLNLMLIKKAWDIPQHS